MKFLLFISALVLVTHSCNTVKNAVPSDIISVKHGTSYGHCMGYCTREEVYTSGSMVYTQQSRDESNPEKVRTEPFSENAFQKLTTSFDRQKWNALPETIGCPDCADGGAEYVEIATTSGVKRVTFDAGSDPEGLGKILAQFRAKRLELEAAESGQ